ncbi:hypothetical protein [Streptomyces anthocyanicus]|uniref:hypothetical protein n=1 Tax=Streptomyces anthocyanicus TaxID=68174 RepID=UPI0038255540
MPASPAVQLPTDPAALADRILAAGTTGLIDDLTAQLGGPDARRILAEAFDIAASRLRNS